MEVKMVGIDEIVPDKDNRKYEEQTLISSVEKEGVINPILLHPRKDGKYDIVDGNRRYLSAKHYGLKNVPAFLVERDDYASIQGAENLDRKPLSMIDMSLLVKRMIAEGMPDDAIRTMTGLGKARYRRMVMLAGLDSKVVKAVKNGDMAVDQAMEIAMLPKDRQKAVMEKLDGDYAGWTVSNAVNGAVPNVNFFSPAFKSCLVDCDACPKHARSPQCELFDDAPYQDLCFDPKCFDRKMEEYTKNVRLVSADSIPDGYEEVSSYGDHTGAEECVDSRGSAVFIRRKETHEPRDKGDVAMKACRSLWSKRLKKNLREEWKNYLKAFFELSRTYAGIGYEPDAVHEALRNLFAHAYASSSCLSDLLGVEDITYADGIAVALIASIVGWYGYYPLELSSPYYPQRPAAVDSMVELYRAVYDMLSAESERCGGKYDDVVKRSRQATEIFEIDYDELLDEQRANGNPNFVEVKHEG